MDSQSLIVQDIGRKRKNDIDKQFCRDTFTIFGAWLAIFSSHMAKRGIRACVNMSHNKTDQLSSQV